MLRTVSGRLQVRAHVYRLAVDLCDKFISLCIFCLFCSIFSLCVIYMYVVAVCRFAVAVNKRV